MDTPLLHRVLIANRGEIVVRVARALHALGCEAVAVYTEPDAGAPFTTAADMAVPLGAAGNYLNMEAIIAAAKSSGAAGIHPGYGFLAENAAFAEAVEKAGLVFVGPTAATILLLGSKSSAKRFLREKCPTVQGIPGADAAALGITLPVDKRQAPTTADVAAWRREAGRIGYPVLLKAAAGGGGKGMRVVQREEDFEAAVESVVVEASGAFGDATFLLEKYVTSVRHIEVQVLGDGKGGVRHLFERECSTQRRHQKLLEECPSPALSKAQRDSICGAAVAVAAAAQYRGAGTVEFIVDARSGEFYFLEVNTRLQVEHAVSELCTGVDVVQAQLLLAAGRSLDTAIGLARRHSDVYPQVYLPGAGLPAEPRGYAIEARLYAEDADFKPCTGTVSGLRLGAGAEFHTAAAPGLRISVHYDGMIAKVVAFSHVSRAAALDVLVRALRGTVAFGVTTNRATLLHLLAHPHVRGGTVTTAMIDNGTIPASLLREPLATAAPCSALAVAAASAFLARTAIKAAARPGPWGAASAGWCLTGRRMASATDLVLEDGTAVTVGRGTEAAHADGREALQVTVAGAKAGPTTVTARIAAARPVPGSGGVVSATLQLFADLHAAAPVHALPVAYHTAPAPSTAWPLQDGAVLETVGVHLLDCGAGFDFGVVDKLGGHRAASRPPTGSMLPATWGLGAAPDDDTPEAAGSATTGGGKSVRAPLPAKVVKVLVESGAAVEAGAPVVVLESMKMESKVAAPAAGNVAVRVKAGDLVQGGAVLFVLQ